MDFYFKYRDYDRTLCSTFRHKGVTLNLYRVDNFYGPVHTYYYVLVKNRSVLFECVSISTIEKKFLDSIYMEIGGSPELFNP